MAAELRVPGDAQQAVVARDNNILQQRRNFQEVKNGITQAQHEAQQAEQAYAEAWSKGDGLGVAQAQRAIQDAQYRIQVMQSGLDEIEPAARQWTLEERLAKMSNLMPEEKDWIRQHPDVPEHRLKTAYEDSQADGLKRGTPEYFKFLEERSYRAHPSEAQPNPGNAARPATNGAQVKPGLSQTELDHAKWSGVTPEEYLRGKQQLAEYKKQGMYNHG